MFYRQKLPRELDFPPYLLLHSSLPQRVLSKQRKCVGTRPREPSTIIRR